MLQELQQVLYLPAILAVNVLRDGLVFVSFFSGN
jgi:hypothetical protein